MADGSYPAPVAANSYTAHTHSHPNYPYPPQQSTIFQAVAPQPAPAAPAQGSYYHNQHQQVQQQPSQDQEENTSSSQGANNEKNSKWTSRDDIDLLDALIKQREMGRARDMKWTNEAWNEIAVALEGSEVVSGGGKKTVQQCKARWQRVNCLSLNSARLLTDKTVISSKLSIAMSSIFAANRSFPGMRRLAW